ncbi:hypothetical protein OHB24_10015 [Kribbella sp. NBC_00482]|uniref:hypothetical protein n=1 Tax=Kribbella sp. NBC_00482 TaxID=2975968 RepID=UPI002E17CED9
MYPEWLMAGLEFPSADLRGHLTRAGELVPAEVLAGSGQAEELAEVVEDGANHFWMDTLHYVGVWAEANGLDEQLPVEFWLHVASAADGMEFPEFVPYCLGKAHRLPSQDPGDLVAAVSTLPAVVEVDGAVRSSCSAVADLLRNHDPATAAMIEAVDLDAIATHLRGGAYDAIGPDVSPILSDSFDDLFGVAARKDFPAEHSRHAWAIIGPNPFKVAVGAGLYPSTHAEVWWRA